MSKPARSIRRAAQRGAVVRRGSGSYGQCGGSRIRILPVTCTQWPGMHTHRQHTHTTHDGKERTATGESVEAARHGENPCREKPKGPAPCSAARTPLMQVAAVEAGASAHRRGGRGAGVTLALYLPTDDTVPLQTMMRVQAHARARLTGIHACAYRASPGAGGGAPRRCPSAHWGSAAAVAPPCARWRTSAPAARLPAAKGPPAAQQARRGAPQRRGPGPWHTPPGARPASAAPRAAAWSLRNGGRYRVRAAVSGGP